MKGTHQILPYADDACLTSDDIRITEKNGDILNACSENGLIVN